VAAPTGGLVQGWFADQIGPRATVAGAGLVMLAIAVSLTTWKSTIRLSRLDDPHDVQTVKD